ncbi:MAG: alternative ribosome rescue aminoacyl-tRNA hydrolase ArfB [Myxococcota bacterium]
MDDLRITDRITIPAGDMSWTAVRSSGPGGQNVNKVATKVDFRFDLEGTEAFSDAVKRRVRELAGPSRLDAEGRIALQSDGARSQSANLEAARARLRALVLEALTPPKVRRATRPSRGAKRRRLEDKRRQGDKKRARRRVEDDN